MSRSMIRITPVTPPPFGGWKVSWATIPGKPASGPSQFPAVTTVARKTLMCIARLLVDRMLWVMGIGMSFQRVERSFN